MESALFKEAILELQVMKSFTKPLREDFAKLMMRVGERMEVPIGETWLHEGEKSPNDGYVLVHGTVSVEREGKLIRECGAPELLGEVMQFNPDAKRTASITAVQTCQLLHFSWETLWDDAEKSFSQKDFNALRDMIEFYAWERLAG